VGSFGDRCNFAVWLRNESENWLTNFGRRTSANEPLADKI